MMPKKKYDVLLDADVWDEKVFQNKHDCINEWLQSKDSTGKSRRTLNAYSRTAAKFFHEIAPNTHPADLRITDIEAWMRDLAQRDCAANTKRRYVESLSSFYDWAMKRPHAYPDITGNPAAVVLEELEKVQRERPDTATWENGKRVIWNIPDPRDKTAAILMAKTGARVEEILSLQTEDLLLDNGFIRLRNRKGGTTTVNPVDEETIEWLHRIQTMNNDTDLLFTSIRGGRITRERIRREVRRAAVRADIMEDEDEKRWHHKFTPHYYRTIWTSLMRNGEPSMRDHWVRYLRGDSNEDVMDLYTRIPQDKVRDRYLEVIKPINV